MILLFFLIFRHLRRVQIGIAKLQKRYSYKAIPLLFNNINNSQINLTGILLKHICICIPLYFIIIDSTFVQSIKITTQNKFTKQGCVVINKPFPSA